MDKMIKVTKLESEEARRLESVQAWTLYKVKGQTKKVKGYETR